MSETKTGKSDKQVIATLTISHMVQHLFSGAPILYQSIREELGLTYTQIGAMVGLVNIVGGLLQMGYSVAARFIPRRILLTLSNVFMGVGCMVMGTAARFETILTGNVTSGLGQAGTHPVSSSIISSKWEKKGVGSALSVFYGLGYVGNIISPLLLSTVVLYAGWRSAYLLLAGVLLLAAALAFMGLRGEPAAEKSVSKQSGRSLIEDVKSALRVKGAVPILAAQALISGGSGMGVMTTWVPVYLRDPTKGLAMDVFTAGAVTSVATVGGVLGTIYIGKLADKRGYLKTSTIVLAATSLGVILLNLYGGFSLLLVPHLFLLSMTTFSISSLLQAHLMNEAGPAERDILLGLFFTFGFGVSSVWSTLLGALVDSYGFSAIWVTMTAAGVIAQVCLWAAGRGKRESV